MTGEASERFIPWIKDAKDVAIALMVDDYAELAPLVAAAPSLLEELKRLVARCDGAEGIQPDGSNMCTIQAHAAIARAERRE